MLPIETLQELRQADAIKAANSAVEPREALVALPEEFKVHDLERFLPHRRRPRGVMSTPFIEPFSAYVKSHAAEGATVFVDPKNMQATAVLNLGTPSNPGHADDKALLTPTKTAAYAALVRIEGQPVSQRLLAEFLEDWTHCIKCVHDEGTAIQNKHAVAAIRKLTIEASRKAETSVQSLSASASTFEAVAARSDDPIPDFIHFETKPYADLERRVFVLRLGISTSSEKAPTITLRLIRAEEHQEEMADELAGLVKAKTGNTPVLIGTYTPS